MRVQKMSFASIQNELAPAEMRGIMAGSGVVGDPYNGGSGYGDLGSVTVTPGGGNNTNYVYYTSGSSGSDSGSGFGGYGSGSGGGGGASVSYYPITVIPPQQNAQNMINNYQANCLSFQHYNPQALAHAPNTAQQVILSKDIMNALSATGLAVDSHNLSTSLVSVLSLEAGAVLSKANVITSVASLAISAVYAAEDINEKGWANAPIADYISVGLGLLGVGLAIADAPTLVTVSLINSAFSLINDASSAAGLYN